MIKLPPNPTPPEPGLIPSNPLIPRQLFYGFDEYAFDPESALKNVSESPKHESDREEVSPKLELVVPEKKKKKAPKDLTGKKCSISYT